MADTFTELHKAKHLLAHVLVAAGVKRWGGAARGKSGETPTGFYADFGLDGCPDEAELAVLADDMARILGEVRTFRDVRLTPRQARDVFSGQPWKRYHAEAIAELEPTIRCSELDGLVDICDCALKDPAELRRVHPEKFVLTGAHPLVWTHRGRDEFFIRVLGELFPRPEPCACCRVARVS